MWVLVLMLAVLGGALWWRHHRDARPPATSTVTQPQRGSGSSSTAVAARATAAPARLAITVTDDRGPLADAAVRLAPGDGEIIMVRTGRDGVAHAGPLEPGSWSVSASAPGHLPAALPATQLAAGAEATLAIRLASGGRTLRGMVSDATGGPIAGARIDAARLDARAEPSDAVSSTFTGVDGSYRLSVAPGTLMVAAASPDYAPQARAVEVGAADAVADFALVPGGVIEGVVRDDRTREPVAGARVVARRDSPAVLLAESGAHRATSGADGRFRLGGLRPGAWELAADDHARFSRAPTIVGLGVAEQVSDVELLIGAGPVIRGTVVDETGAPAADAALQAFTRGAGSDARADARGAFVFEGLRPGEYVLTARGPGYLPTGDTRVALADKDVDHVVVTVRRGTTIKGHVEPRQACEVQQAADERPGAPMMTPPGVSTGPDGEFAIGPAADGPARLTARCASGDQGAAQVTVTPGMAELILKVAPGASIAGHVVDGDGKPVAGAGVIANEVTRGERTTISNGVVTSGAQGVTDASGAYTLDGLSPGTYQLGALDRGRPMRLRGAPPRVELAVNEHKTGVDLAIDRPSGVIKGTVTGPDGKPLADAWVSVQQDVLATLGDGDRGGASGSRMVMIENRDGPGGGPDTAAPPALTDAQGRYEIRGLPRATYNVIAEAQRGQLRARAGNIKPDATVDLQVLGVTTLSGTVTGPAGPSALFSVELEGPTRAQRSFTGGTFSFGRVDPGTYTVRVEASDGSGQATVDVAANKPATVAIALTSNAVVIGKLVDAAGAPIAGQAIALVPDSDDGRLQVRLEGPPQTTGPDGSFRLEHRAERCVLFVMRPPRPFTRRGLILEPGKTLDLGAVVVDAPGSGSGAPPRP